MTTSLPVAFGPQIAAAAQRHHLDPRLLAAVAAQETGGPQCDSGRNVVGDGGHGRGVFQIDDRWHPFARSPAAMNPARNADYAAALLRGNLDRYGGDVRAALSAYNAGSPAATGTLTDWGDGKPVGYAESVLRHYARLGAAARPDVRETSAGVNALRGFAAATPPAGSDGFTVSFPAHKPQPAVDPQRLADAAPSAADDPDADPSRAAATA